jgi:hypothetical protein
MSPLPGEFRLTDDMPYICDLGTGPEGNSLVGPNPWGHPGSTQEAGYFSSLLTSVHEIFAISDKVRADHTPHYQLLFQIWTFSRIWIKATALVFSWTNQKDRVPCQCLLISGFTPSASLFPMRDQDLSSFRIVSRPAVRYSNSGPWVASDTGQHPLDRRSFLYYMVAAI